MYHSLCPASAANGLFFLHRVRRVAAHSLRDTREATAPAYGDSARVVCLYRGNPLRHAISFYRALQLRQQQRKRRLRLRLRMLI